MSELPDPEALEAEAAALSERVKQLKHDAALARVKRDEIVIPVRAPTMPHLRAGLRDNLLMAAAIKVEDIRGEFTARDLAVALGIADTNRAARLLRALVEIEKVRTTFDSEHYRVERDGEEAVRDYVLEHLVGTVEEIAAATDLEVAEVDEMLGGFYAREVIEFDEQGRWVYVIPDGENGSRVRRRPPEKDPPCFSEARASGMPVRIVLHGKRAKQASVPGQGHKLRLRDAAYARQQEAAAASREGAKVREAREAAKYANKRKKSK